MSYKVVQKQSNGRYYLYEVTGVWDPVKKNSKQTRTYLGVCDAEGNLLKEPARNRTVSCSPVYGPYQLFVQLAEGSGLTSALDDVYGVRDGRRLLAMAILGIVDPVTVNQMENVIDDTYLRELLGVDWGFEQSSVCRFLQTVGHASEQRELLFNELAPKSGCVIFDIVCLGTDSEDLEYAEAGRKTHLTGSRQFNLGMVHSMEDNLPFCYRTYPGSVADVSTLDNIVSDLRTMDCSPVELEMDRGFFSIGNVQMMLERGMGFTVPIPARVGISKLLLSESVREIDSPLNTDYLARSVVRGYETFVRLEDDELVKASEGDAGAIRALVFQDDSKRTKEIATLYSRIGELENRLSGTEYDRFARKKLTRTEQQTADLLEFAADCDGKTVVTRKRNAISAKENACGRFAVITTSDKHWLDLLMQYRLRNGVEYDFSQLQSDLFVGITGKSDQDSAEGGLLVNFLSLRLRLTLINLLKEKGLADDYWVPDVLNTLKKLKISCIGGKWRLNEVTKAQRELFEALGVNIQ
ncbi:IS1634 family transposase [Methanomethylophilus alvi]|uniref:IS1634 family transposase n=1 Tax=Methanomethylophilus alvi TaxID=1291540 RepID=UPI0037DCF348